MRFSHFFIDRPIFAGVISIILTLVGAISFRALPITEYPEIATPTVEVTATYAGAAAEVIADTVAAPIEQEINGVDNMLYVVSQSTGNGALSINVVFKPGTNIDHAQVLVQNRVSVALPRLPEEVQRIGVTVQQEIARPDARHPSDLAGRNVGPALHLQLCHHQHQGRPDPHRRRGRHGRIRRARLLHAGLARSRQGAGARPDRRRCRRRATGCQCLGRGRRHQSAARDVARRFRDRGADARPIDEPGSIRRDRGGDRCGRPGDAGPRHRQDRARRPGLQAQRLPR